LDLHDKNARLINWMVLAANFDKKKSKKLMYTVSYHF
jgi:hypothetical protein